MSTFLGLYYGPRCFMSVGLLFPLWAVPAEIRGLGCWMETRGSSFFSSGCFHSLWMNVTLGNVPHEQRREPLNPEGICLWQTTSPASASNKTGEGVILSSSAVTLLAPSGHFWFLRKGQWAVMLQTIYSYPPQQKGQEEMYLDKTNDLLAPERWRGTIKQTEIKLFAHSYLKRSNIKKLLNDWHWQMLSVLAGLCCRWLAAGWGDQDGKRQLSGPDALWSLNSWDREGPGRHQSVASGTRLYDGESPLKRGDGVCQHTQSRSLSWVEAITQISTELTKCSEQKSKVPLTGTQLTDSCAEDTRRTAGVCVRGNIWRKQCTTVAHYHKQAVLHRSHPQRLTLSAATTAVRLAVSYLTQFNGTTTYVELGGSVTARTSSFSQEC